jgi:hypothetical protein
MAATFAFVSEVTALTPLVAEAWIVGGMTGGGGACATTSSAAIAYSVAHSTRLVLRDQFHPSLGPMDAVRSHLRRTGRESFVSEVTALTPLVAEAWIVGGMTGGGGACEGS